MFNCFLGKPRSRRAELAAAALLLTGIAGVPQTAAARNSRDYAAEAAGGSGLKLSQPELLREFEAVSEEEYTLGAGDEIEVQAPGQADLQGHHIVGPDGQITLPVVGSFPVSGLTREEAARSIAKAFGQYYSRVTVTVQVTKYGSNRIVVVGRVASPGPLYFDTAPTLLEALAKSGAYTPRPVETGTAGNAVTATGAPAGMLSRCGVYRGSEQVLWINMKDLFAGGSGVDLHLRRGDVVYVPDEQEDLVSVLGQVQHPGAVRLTAETTLIDVVATAGGLTEDAAADHIQVVRASNGTSREVALKDLLDPTRAHLSEISLERGDVIYVPKSGLGKVGHVLNKLGPASSLMMFGAIAAGR